jgi:PAS domain S-box-containing protein
MDGMPSSTIHGIAQDGQGRLWFASRHGITVYAGNFKKNFAKNIGVWNSIFTAISRDQSGNIWGMSVSSSIRLICFSGENYRLINSPDYEELNGDYNSNNCFAVYADQKDTIAVIGSGKSGVYVYRNGSWNSINIYNGMPSNEIRDIKENNGLFYVLTAKGIAVLDKNLTVNSFNYSLPSNVTTELRSIVVEKGNNPKNTRFWFLGNTFISTLADGNYKTIVSGFNMGELTKIDYPRFYPNYHGLYFFGTSRNLFLYNENTKKTTLLSNQKNSIFTGINSAIRDREDNLWIISDRGAYKIRNTKFTNLNSQNGLYKDEVTAVHQMGSTMVFGHEGGITFYNADKSFVRNINDQFRFLAYCRVLQFAGDNKGNLWFAAAKRGLGKINKIFNIEWFNLPKEENLNVASVANDKAGNIFAATANRIYKYENGKFLKINIGKIGEGGNIRRILINSKNEILICTMNFGLFAGDEKKGFKNYKSIHFAAANNIYSVYSDNNEILVGTLGGLFCVNGDSLKKYEKIQVDRPVYFINREKDNFWIGTDLGATKWHDGSQINLTPLDNLSGIETNRGGFFVDNNGDVWIGTDKGVSKYIGPLTSEKAVKPNLIVSLQSSHGVRNLLKEKIELPYSENELLVSINVISFVNEERNTYSAMLENFDSDWLPETEDNDKLRYTNLPPGTYRLKIKGKNALGIWGDEFVSAEIVVLAPFYRQWWFLLFAAGMVLFIAYMIARYLGKQKYTYQLEKEVKNRTSQLEESESKYRSLISNIHDGVFVVQGKEIRYVNRSMAEMIGCTIEELIGSEWNSFIYENEGVVIEDFLKKRANRKDVSAQYEMKMKHKNGTILNVIVNLGSIEYENAPATLGTIKDMTEQKAKEAELIKLSTAAQQSPSAIIIAGPDGLIEYVNPIFEKITGFSSDEIIGEDIKLLESGLMDNEILEDLWSTISSGNIWHGELLNRRKNKELYWLSASIAPIRNTRGVITNYISVEEDITFKKFARQKIEKEEKLLATTLANVPVIIFVLDRTGRFIFIRGNGLDLLGFHNEEELIGKPISALFGEDEVSDNNLRRISLDESFTSLKFIKGLVFEVHFSAITEKYEDDSAAIGLAVNITDYYKAEQTIKKSEAEIKALLTAIPDYMFEINRDNMVVTSHRPADKIFPWEFQGRNVHDVLSPAGIDCRKYIDAVFTTGENQMQILDFIYKGERKYFEVRYVLKDEESLVAIVRDITEKTRAECELKKAKEVAEKSDRLKSEFLAHMSHEIRTPVNTIMNYTSLIEDELSDNLSEELKDSFGVIRSGGFRLVRTIDLILNMSQIQTGTYSPNFNYIDVDKKVLPGILREFHFRAKSKNIELIYKMNSTNSTIYADDYTIGQIFANLIDNALKYTKEGKIEVILSNSDGKLHVEVIDTGIGISSEYLPKLFSPFTQEEMGYTRRFDGTGLGLALVKQYVEINNAEIFVESEKEKGARFVVTFPLADITEKTN